MARNKIVTIVAPHRDKRKEHLTVTGALVTLQLEDKPVQAVIHDQGRGIDQTVFLTDYRSGAKWGEILPDKGKSRKVRAQHLIDAKVRQHGLERVEVIVSKQPELNTELQPCPVCGGLVSIELGMHEACKDDDGPEGPEDLGK